MKIRMLILAGILGPVLLGFLAPAPATGQTQLYRWVDAEGQVHYSDLPPPPGARQVERRNLADKPADQGLPFALQAPVRNFPVTLYVSDCGSGCDRARALLRKRGIPHTEKRLEEPGVREELRALSGGDLFVPYLTVGRTRLAGYTDDQWNKALDFAGYPANALIQLPPPKPAPKPEAVPAAQTGAAPDGELPQDSVPEDQVSEDQAPEDQQVPAVQ